MNMPMERHVDDPIRELKLVGLLAVFHAVIVDDPIRELKPQTGSVKAFYRVDDPIRELKHAKHGPEPLKRQVDDPIRELKLFQGVFLCFS